MGAPFLRQGLRLKGRPYNEKRLAMCEETSGAEALFLALVYVAVEIATHTARSYRREIGKRL